MTSSSQQCSVSEYVKPWLLADLLGSETCLIIEEGGASRKKELPFDAVLLVPVLLHFVVTFQYS